MLVRRSRFVWLALGLVLLLLLLLAWAAPLNMGFGGPHPANAAPVGQAETGQEVYQERCAACHGTEGDGDGPGADLLDPRPRDFRRGLYKVRTTASGQLPTDDDLFRIISNGMPGTAMPGWSGVLSTQERNDVIAYIKTFSRKFERGPAPDPLAIGSAISSSPESIAKGRDLYFGDLECYKCHGQEGRGDGPSALELEDDYGFTIVPANLTKSWNFRGGDSPEDIARTFLTGLLGTPMPSYEGQIESDEVWHLANFVRSLSPKRKPEVTAVLSPRRVEGPLPDSPNDPQWSQEAAFFYPLVGQITQSPRNFTPTLDAVTVSALFNEEELALLLTWDDRSENRTPEDERTVDALAVQFPQQIPKGSVKPSFLEGEPARPVNLWRWQADTGALEEMNATGLGTALPQGGDSETLAGGAVYDNGQWRLLLKRSLLTQESGKDTPFELDRFIPVAFSAWDGQNGETGSQRAVSSWYLMYLQQPTTTGQWLQVPGRIGVVVILEVLVLWWVRRRGVPGT